MKPEPPDLTDPTPSTQEPDPSSRSSGKRPREPSLSPDPLLPAASSDAPSGHRSRKVLKLAQAQIHRPSSSSQDMTEVHRSSTPPEASNSAAVKYTRTGRVSKATKGRRVHHCEECGKTYTRAEHLRRHQQNHKPGAYPCDFPDCTRSFYREDLLIRHRARHNDPFDSPSRRQSFASHSSAPDGPGGGTASASAPGLLLPPTSDPGTLAPELRQRSSDTDAPQSQPSVSSRLPKQVIPPNELALGVAPVSVTVDGVVRRTQFRNPFNPETPLSPGPYNDQDYESPDELSAMPSYYQHSPTRARYISDASYLGSPTRARYISDASYLGQPHTSSRSSLSAGSSTVYVNQWPFSSGCDALPPSNSANAFAGEYGLTLSGFPYGASRILTADTRDSMERSELDVLGSAYHRGSFDYETLDTPASPDDQRYLIAYWTIVHNLYPVIHRPTYIHETASPLLRAALLALGAQAMGDRNDLSNARVLHEKCIKVLKKRTIQATHTYRVCDMQAIFLIELYSVFKSRRAPLQFSKTFEDIYHMLSNDPSALISSPSDTPTDSGSFSDDTSEATFPGLVAACKQRLLLACYALEQQYNALFGKSSSPSFNGLGLHLPFPRLQTQWDASILEISDMPAFDRVSEALKSIPYMTAPASEPHDAFQSLLIMTYLCDSTRDGLEWGDVRGDYSLLLAVERTPRMKLAFHTLMLSRHAPIRELLAVAGESWIMAEKLSTQAEYTTAQMDLRHWASQNFSPQAGGFAFDMDKPFIQRAFEHALAILEIHRDTPRTGLIFHDWAVYLAALTVWARAYAMRPNGLHPRLSMSSPLEPNLTSTELDHAVRALISAGSFGVLGWTEARNMLLWTNNKFAQLDVPHACGLTSSALDIIGKLAARGNDDGWF